MDDIFTKVPEVLCILPDNRFYHSHREWYLFASVLHVVYNFVVTMIPVVLGAICIRSGDYPKDQVPVEIMTLARTALYALIVSLSVLYQNVLYPDEYIAMKASFRAIDAALERCGERPRGRWLRARFALFVAVYVLYVAYTYHVYRRSAHALYIVLVGWIHFNFVLEIILAWHWLGMLCERLRLFNALVQGLDDVRGKRAARVSDLLDIQRRIVRIVGAFNQLVGVSVALRSLMFVIEILGVVLRIVVGVDEDLMLAVVDALIDACGWCVFVIKSQHVTDAGRLSANYCLDAISSWLQRGERPEAEMALLAHLGQRVTSQMPQFTAARFYSVDFAAIFMIVNMTTGYIIIVVQFAQP